jgi:hypothetical protein
MAGLLDLFNSDDGRLGLSLLAAAGPSATPMGFGQRLQGAMGSFDDYKKDKVRTQLADMQMQTGLLGLTKAKQEAADDEASREVMRNFYAGSGLPGLRPQGGGPTGAVNAGLPADMRISAMPATPGFQQPAAGGVTPKVDLYAQYKGLSAQFASAGLGKQAQQYAELAEKYRPKYNTTPQQMVVGGKLMNVLVGEDGSMKTLDGYEVKPDMVEQDLGGVKQWVNKNALMPGQTFAKTLTPGEVASNSLGWANNRATLRGQDLTDARARDTLQQGKTQLLNDPNQGPMLVNKATGVAVPVTSADGTRVPSDASAKQLKGSQRALDIIGEAEKLIQGATGSYVGNAVDKSAQAVGLATPGAQNIARLKALEGSLMMAQPRMEGPQSDKDVALYRQMSGQIGDPNVPPAIKSAALDTIRSLHEKYTGVQQSTAKAPTTPPMPMKGMTRGGYRFTGGNPADPSSWEKI